MIVLDTNYLIRGLVRGTDEAKQIDSWLDEREDLCTSSICWYKFLSGPVDAEGIELMRAVLHDRILPFDRDTAVEAARLFNASGRNRRLRVDAMIAASATMTGSRLATATRRDFAGFGDRGPRVV